MEPLVTAVLTNAQGWQKYFRLTEGIFLIGTAADSFIRLPEGENIAPYHVQMVNNEQEAHVRLVNLSSNEMILESGAQETMFLPHTMHDLFGGETLYLGPYKLKFDICKEYVPRQVAQEQNQQVVGLRMVLNNHVLHPGEVVSGTLYLRNLGSEPCQFNVEMDGLPPECYEIDPPPLINPGGEETSGIRIYHRWTAPAAGNTLLTLRISAPTVYPGRQLALQQMLKVYPSYRFRAVWGEAAPAAEVAQAAEPEEALLPPPLPANRVDSVVSPEMAAGAGVPMPPDTAPAFSEPVGQDAPATTAAWDAALTDDEAAWAARWESPSDPRPIQPPVEEVGPPPTLEPPASTSLPRPPRRPDLSGVKVVRGSSGEFLDEKGKQS